MHPLRTITKQVLSNVKFNAAKIKPYKDHRVALKEGTQVAQTVSTPGFKLILDDIKDEIAKIAEQWMDEKDKVKQEELRFKALAYKEVLKKFDKYLMKRDIARKAIRQKKQDLEPQD